MSELAASPNVSRRSTATMFGGKSSVVNASTLSAQIQKLKKKKILPRLKVFNHKEKSFVGTGTTEFKMAKHCLETEQRRIAETPIEESSAPIDLPRLMNRVIVRDRRSNVVFDGGSPSTAEIDVRVGTLSKIVKLIGILSELLEDRAPSRREEMQTSLQSILLSAGSSDMQLIVGAMFEIIGSDSNTAKILKLINQSVILSAMSFLKTTLTKSYMTKDVRSADGWKIEISFERADERLNLWTNLNEGCMNGIKPTDSESPLQSGAVARKSQLFLGGLFLHRKSNSEDVERRSSRCSDEAKASKIELLVPSISVCHIRKEQSTDPFGDRSEHFEFEWDLTLRLKLETLNLMEVQLNIRDLQFDNTTMPKKKGKHLKNDLALRRVV
jgi:hypothetical protein